MLQLESVLLLSVLVTTGRAFHQSNPHKLCSISRRASVATSTISKISLPLQATFNFYNDFEGFEEPDDDEEDDDDEYLTLSSNQMDWRDFRRQLVLTNEQDSFSEDTSFESTGKSEDISTLTERKSNERNKSTKKKNQRRISAENKELLKGQSQLLYQEFETVWAHETATVRPTGFCLSPGERHLLFAHTCVLIHCYFPSSMK